MRDSHPDAYDPSGVERKWQQRWEERGTNRTDLAGARRPFFNLMMFPYPSAEGLHVGNVFAFIGADIHGRFRRLQGHDVFEPLGFDAFGIHSENYALKVGVHPAELIPRNVARFRTQLRRIGLMVDWRYEVNTTDPAYYKWTQWIFLQLHRAGLAVRKRAAVNWCPACKTVLANEQVVGGYCERHPDVKVEQRVLEQWFFTITKYTERLLGNLASIDWSQSTRLLQTNWIGRSEGAELAFVTPGGRRITVFTTRPDTVFGATYLVLAPEHPLVNDLTTAEQRADVKAYQRAVAARDVVSRKVGEREKSGVFTGAYARHPATGESVPIWIADYVLMEYGTGAIMAVPGHDQRDFEFATAFKLPIVRVVARAGQAADAALRAAEPDIEDGHLVHSGRFDGLPFEEGQRAIVAHLAEKGLGKAVANYRLHDWCVSRQRYWGPPIPIIYCEEHGAVPVPERDLPVVLPHVEDTRPDDSGVSPLARHEAWYRAPCPTCGKPGRRETDVSDTFLDSAWYFLRYPSADRPDVPFDAALTRQWLPVASYIGGNEHAVLHLLYSRFVTMALHDMGLVPFEEPYAKFRAHGTIVKDGAKMSKSRGNVVVPDQYIEQWGADTFRMYLMFLGPYQEGGDFRDAGIAGIRRFLDKVWGLVEEVTGTRRQDAKEGQAAVVRLMHRTIRKVTADTEHLDYNTAISAMMEYVNALREAGGAAQEQIEPLVVMLAPYAPHFAEECWERLGHAASVMAATWPSFDAALTVEDEVEIVVQVNGKVRGRLKLARGVAQQAALDAALADAGVRRFVDGQTIRKTVFVPDKLLSLVV
ncbi:MAG: leucine--tRNA ligase [Gemmatimonadetes bacterium GWC2_71_10]|nr:MAG: leucine--tRNA ligase [Gemmatimonadetes bacterium GWC2_71_10]